MATEYLRDFPRKADIVKEIYLPLPIVPQFPDERTGELTKSAQGILHQIIAALRISDSSSLEGFFCQEQAYWRDSLAMTAHLRTFKGRETIAGKLLTLDRHRKMRDARIVPGSAKRISGGPNLVSWHSVWQHGSSGPLNDGASIGSSFASTSRPNPLRPFAGEE